MELINRINSINYNFIMKKRTIRIMLCIGVLLETVSCSLPNGISIGPTGNNGEQTLTLNFSKVSLRFDFEKKLQTAFIISDYYEFINAHCIPYNDSYSGAITSLSTVLWNEQNYDDSHKPSITVTIEDMFGKTDHHCKAEDITGNTVLGIPNPDNFYKGTVEIKSIKTSQYGIQVVWKNSATKDNWPINEFVKDGSISCDVPSIIKVGTNNNSGDVAGRGGVIIGNTSDELITDSERYIIKDVQLLSPDLCKPVMVNGEISNEVKWSEPVIYQAI